MHPTTSFAETTVCRALRRHLSRSKRHVCLPFGQLEVFYTPGVYFKFKKKKFKRKKAFLKICHRFPLGLFSLQAFLLACLPPSLPSFWPKRSFITSIFVFFLLSSVGRSASSPETVSAPSTRVCSFVATKQRSAQIDSHTYQAFYK